MTTAGAQGLCIRKLGLVEYEDGLRLQKVFAQARAAGAVGDTLLLLEHPPVLTLGRGAKRENILAAPEALAREGVDVFDTDRGGDVTYHGPGQLVGYPIVLLPLERRDVRKYVRSVEEAVLQTLSAFGLEGKRIAQWPGVWLGEEGRDARKVAAIGVHISRWLTTHGFALNVQPRLEHFQLIVPCGIRAAGVTSMAKELGHALPMEDVQRVCAEAFSRVFEQAIVPAEGLTRTVSVVALRPGAAGPEVLLLQRRPERGGFWQPVTGRVEPGEDAAEAARRELSEETGLGAQPRSLDYVHAFAWGEGPVPDVVEESAFAVAWPSAATVQVGPEHSGYAWVSPEEAIERVPFRGLKVAIRKAALDFPALRIR